MYNMHIVFNIKILLLNLNEIIYYIVLSKYFVDNKIINIIELVTIYLLTYKLSLKFKLNLS